MDALGPLILPVTGIRSNTTMNISFDQSDLLFFGIPFVSSLGLILNTLVLIVIVKSPAVHQVFAPLGTLLCVADGGFLLVLLLTWMGKHYINIYRLTGVCQLAVFVSHMFGFMSSWLIVAVAVMTLCSITTPKNFSKFCSRTVSRFLSCVFGVFIFAGYLYKTWTHGTIETEKGPFCTVIRENRSAMNILSTIDVLLIVFAPCVVIFIVQASLICSVVTRSFKKQNPAEATEVSERFCDNSEEAKDETFTACYSHLDVENNHKTSEDLEQNVMNIDLLDVTDIFMEPLKTMAVSRRNSHLVSFSEPTGENCVRLSIHNDNLQLAKWPNILSFTLFFMCLVLPGAVENIAFLTHRDKVMTNLQIYNGFVHQFFQLLFYCHFALDAFMYVTLTGTFGSFVRKLFKSS